MLLSNVEGWADHAGDDEVGQTQDSSTSTESSKATGQVTQDEIGQRILTALKQVTKCLHLFASFSRFSATF